VVLTQQLLTWQAPQQVVLNQRLLTWQAPQQVALTQQLLTWQVSRQVALTQQLLMWQALLQPVKWLAQLVLLVRGLLAALLLLLVLDLVGLRWVTSWLNLVEGMV
jgi:hypothetical protein